MYINSSLKTPKGTASLQDISPDLRKYPEPAFIITATMTDASFKQEFLNAHNEYRKKHSSPPLTLCSELSGKAQKWADHLLSINSLEHSKTDDGENIYNMFSSAPITLTGREAVESWYSEIKDYNWSTPGFNSDTGHFTQVVWKESTKLGVGMATDGNKVFVVGQYRPAGNMNTEEYFHKNVLPLAGREVGGARNPTNEGGRGSQKKTCTLL